MKKLYIKYKFFIWPLFSGLASLIILSFVIIPQFITFLNTQGKISDLSTRSDSLDVKAESLEHFDEENIKNNLKTVLTVLPTEQDVPKSMSILEALVQKSDLKLVNTTYIATRKVGDKPKFQLNISVAGPISSIRNFLISLQDSPQVFQVESIAVQFRKSGMSNVEAEIPISVFYEPVPKTIGSLDQPLKELSQDEENLLGRLSRLVPQTSNAISNPEASSSSIPIGKSDPFE